MEIQINVTIGTTPALESLLKAIVSSPRGSHTVAEANDALPEEAGALKAHNAAAGADSPDAQHQGAAADNQEAQTEEVKYDAAYARKVMDETRKRIEGPDYKDDPDAPGRKKYHTQLTAIFKQIATQLGGTEKPSALNPEQMQKFAQECACIEIEGDKVVVNYQPF